MIWWAVLLVAVLILLVHARGRNAVWGTATFALLVGVAVAALWTGFHWWVFGDALVAGTLLGAALEYAPRMLNRRTGL